MSISSQTVSPLALRVQPLAVDLAQLGGLSEKLVVSHHENNYAGAVKRLNAIRAQLATVDFSAAPGFMLNGLKREELIATNSMLLHELHFSCLRGNAAPMVPAMTLALAGSFGSVERWRDEFVAMGKALAGGSGWVLLCFQPRDGTLVNQWSADHTHAIAGGVPVLALDMYEHAYHMDFGAAAGSWVDAFMRNIDWAVVYERYQHAVHGASEPLAAAAGDVATASSWMCGAPASSSRPRRHCPAPPGAIRHGCRSGPRRYPGTGRSWCIASTATKSAAAPRCSCARTA